MGPLPIYLDLRRVRALTRRSNLDVNAGRGLELETILSDVLVRVWDVASGRETATLTGHGTWVGSVAWSPAGDQLASGGNDGAVRVWDVAAATTARSGHGTDRPVRCTPSGTRHHADGHISTAQVSLCSAQATHGTGSAGRSRTL